MVSLIRRQANLVADKLAKTSRFHVHTKVYDFIPHLVYPIIMNEMK